MSAPSEPRCARCGYDPTYIDSEGYAVQEHECLWSLLESRIEWDS